MKRGKLLIAGGLTGFIIVLVIGIIIFVLPIGNIFIANFLGERTFDNSTPEATAVSIARLNLGQWGFDSATIKSVHLTSDGKYWIVEIYNSVYQDGFDVVTVDAKTWASKINSSYEPNSSYTWRSMDELKACYIAEIQSSVEDMSKPHKITMNGKEIWKVPVYDKDSYDLGKSEKVEYVYVDVATGKSKNTWDEFNNASGTDNWLTLKQVDDTISKMYGWEPIPFRDTLRDLYSK